MYKGIMSLAAICFLLLMFSQLSEASPAGCLQCHQGIESIGEKHEDMACEDCHNGNPEGSTKEDAHSGMHKNPGDLNIVDQTCGECHADTVSNVKKSLHATVAVQIS